MDAFLSTIITVMQIVLGGFVGWGAWLVFRTAHASVTAAPRAQPDDFERVASLVLLALLCTTLAAGAG